MAVRNKWILMNGGGVNEESLVHNKSTTGSYKSLLLCKEPVKSLVLRETGSFHEQDPFLQIKSPYLGEGPNIRMIR